MKHLDTLLDELQHPVDIVQAWCDEDKDRAVVACIKDLHDAGDEDDSLADAISEAYPKLSIAGIASTISMIVEEIGFAESEGAKPYIDYEKLYSPLEHIINERIDLYNRS